MIVGFITISLLTLFISSCSSAWRDIDEAEKNFQKHKDLFLTLRDFLIESEYNDISITPSMEKGEMFVNIAGNSYVPIDSDEFICAANLLLNKHGYSSISKTDSYVEFGRTQTYDTIYYGIAYSADGQVPDDSVIQFLTSIESLTEDGWYHYEARYNEYRQRDRSEPNK